MYRSKIAHFLKLFYDSKYRFAVLSQRGWYFWLSDEAFVKRYYKYRMGKKLNLKEPKTFNEKMQWLKLYHHKNEFINMVDKFEVKKWVASVIGEQYIIPTLGIWNNFDEIDFESLPNQFVLKCTHDSGGLVICRDKTNFDVKSAEHKIKFCLKKNFYNLSREWPYKFVVPRIIAEPFISNGIDTLDNIADGLIDYKFFCFNSIPRILYVSKGLENHKTAKISFLDMNGREMPFHRSDYESFGYEINLPSNFSDMKSVAKKLASSIDSPFVRIDLYSVNEQVLFSEITFTPCGGTLPFEPAEWDEKLGNWICIK